MDNASHALRIAGEFDLGGTVAEVLPHGNGLINDTYRVKVEGGRDALLQRLNTQVFPHPELILANMRTLLEHARHQMPVGLRLPALFPTRAGMDYFVDDQGGFWRALEFIPNTRNLKVLENAGQAQAVGTALGQFHRLLHELPIEKLHTTLPGFHVTPEYLRHFDEIALDSVAGHGIALRDALAFVEERRELTGVLERARERGDLALRPTHGDPKRDNFLFDTGADQVVALIDLDTVQPGLVQVDLADCLRSCCNRAGEATTDLYSVRLDLDFARAILRGYLAEAREFLTSEDYGYLYDAIRLIPFELGLRFLTDHFAGDRYFKVTAPGQNLQRARVQFRLTEDIERHEGTLRHLIESLAAA